MNLNAIERHWDGLIDTLLDLFPELDSDMMDQFEGRISAFVEHLAEAHHLTRQEAVDTLGQRLILPATASVAAHEPRMAAE